MSLRSSIISWRSFGAITLCFALFLGEKIFSKEFSLLIFALISFSFFKRFLFFHTIQDGKRSKAKGFSLLLKIKYTFEKIRGKRSVSGPFLVSRMVPKMPFFHPKNRRRYFSLPLWLLVSTPHWVHSSLDACTGPSSHAY